MTKAFQEVLPLPCEITMSPRPENSNGKERISNGELLKLAEEAGFDLLVTTDKNLRYQQNLANRKISIVVLGQSPWWLVRQRLEPIVVAVNAAAPGSYFEVEIPFSAE